MTAELLQIAPVAQYTPLVRTARKLRVYTMEANIVVGAFRYLPYSTGLLRAYAMTDSLIKDNVEFMPFLYEMDTPENILAKIDAPDIMAFSVAMWNAELNLKVAAEVKNRWPNCLIIFGGCHVPHQPQAYMTEYQFIDVCVRSEGEEAFREVLQRRVQDADYDGVLGVTWRRKDGEIVANCGSRPFQKDLDQYPSPYVLGHFDYLLRERKEGKNGWQAILETNRGCPF